MDMYKDRGGSLERIEGESEGISNKSQKENKIVEIRKKKMAQ